MVMRLRQLAKAAVLRRVHARNERGRRRLGQRGPFLAPATWDLSIDARGHLALCDVDSVDLADSYGTPLHVVHRPRLCRDFEAFRAAFAQRWPDVVVAYSYKTNPVPGVLAELHALGAWAEVISHFELWLALELGVPVERIIYNGPAKSADGLRLAMTHGIGLVNVDNAEEIDQIGQLAGATPRKQNVGVRVVTSVGWSGQFGHRLADGEAYEAFSRLAQMQHVAPNAVHVHLGTSLRDVDTYVRAAHEVLAFARDLERRLGITIDRFDFGGGFGVPTVRPYSEWDERLLASGYPPRPIDLTETPDIEAFARPIAELLHAHCGLRTPRASSPMLILEPGRAITSRAQTLLLRVLAIKEWTNGTLRVILDGGKNIALPTGYEMHELLPASRMLDMCIAPHTFFGPLCHPGDVLVRNKSFPRLAAGDVVALMDAGAYFVPNQMTFSNPRPAIAIVDERGHRLLRARESFNDVVRLDFAARDTAVRVGAGDRARVS
jgi:diaminopimelate decarboxylase